MKTWGRLMVLVMLCGIFLWVDGARAGEVGEVTCTSPGCGYKNMLNIGGRMNSHAVTGYCPKEKKFVRVRLKSNEDAKKPQKCPNDKEPLVPIYKGADVAQVPCPKCGNLTLKYEMKMRKD